MSREPLALLTADLHLARQAWANRPLLYGDAYFALEQLVDIAIRRRVPLVAAGDLLDSKHPTAQTVRVLLDQIERLRTSGNRFYFVSGQHCKSDPPWLCVVDWPIHLSECNETIGGVTFGGFDWQPRHQLEERLRLMPEYDVLVMHQVWQTLMPQGNWECDFNELREPRLLLTGDLHAHGHLMAAGRTGRQFPVLVPGSTCQQAVDETPQKAAWLLYDDISFESVRLFNRPFHQLSLNGAAGLEEFVAKVDAFVEPALLAWVDDYHTPRIPEHLRKPAIWLKYDDDIENAYGLINTAVADRAHLFLSPRVPVTEHRVVEDAARREAVGRGLLGCLELVCPADSDTYRDAVRLLSSPAAPEAELNTMRQEQT